MIKKTIAVRVDSTNIDSVLLWLSENAEAAWPDGAHPMDNLPTTMEILEDPMNSCLVYEPGIIYMEDEDFIGEENILSVETFKSQISMLSG